MMHTQFFSSLTAFSDWLPSDEPCEFDHHPFAYDIYRSALHRLEAADIDQEVKERAITCMSVRQKR